MSKEVCLHHKLTENDEKEIIKRLKNKEIYAITITKSFSAENNTDLLELLKKYTNFKKLHFVSPKDIHYQEGLFVETIINQNTLDDLHLELHITENGKYLIETLENQSKIERFALFSFDLYDKKFLKSVKKMINNNQNLTSLNLSQIFVKNEQDINLDYLYDGLKENNSLTELSIYHEWSSLNNFSFFNKFKMLKKLEFETHNYSLTKLLVHVSTESHPFLKSLILVNPTKIENDLDFSKTSITSLDINLKNYDSDFIYNLFNSLRNHKILKTFKIFLTKKDVKDSPWGYNFKEIISGLKELRIANIPFNKEQFKLFIQGLQKNSELELLEMIHINYKGLEKDFAQILTSNESLKDLSIYNPSKDNFEIYSFLQHFHHQNLKSLDITCFDWNEETASLLSNLILNNSLLENLSISNSSPTNIDLICKSIESHKKLKNLKIQFESVLKGKYFFKMIQNNSSLESVEISQIGFDQDKVKPFFESLMKNQKLNNLMIDTAKNLKTLIQDYLFFNLNLTYFYFGGLSPFKERNLKFIKNYYKFSDQLKDIQIRFE